jgi:hypothetical protein
MSRIDNFTMVENATFDQWAENFDEGLPEDMVSAAKIGRLKEIHHETKIKLGVRRLPNGEEVPFKAKLTDTLGEVFARGAEVLDEPLLPPPPQKPFDTLRYRKHRGEWSEPVTNLDQPLWLALAHGVTRHLGIEYRLAVKINTRWGIAPSSTATPRELLTSFGMNPQDFSLYTVDGVEPLPPDTPLSLQRGDYFEAQKDGKYGSTVSLSRAPRGSQTIEDDVEAAGETGVSARLITVGAQKYVEGRDISVPSPPWSSGNVNILIAVPATYPSGGLDAFYVELPVTHASGSIPNQQSTVSIDGRNWALISWHYHETRPWNPLQDDLTTHIQHCRGFFLKRGIRQ